MSPDAEPNLRAERLASGFTGWPRRRITLIELWRILDQTDPASRTSSTRRALLADALTNLAAAGRVVLPASASWDRTEEPHLPRFVTLPEPDTSASMIRAIIWHPMLSWADGERLTPTRCQLLAQVNQWLHTNRDTSIVPLRERSLEIFGYEKTLDRLTLTNLFEPGKLTLELLRCRRVAPRFTTAQVGDGDLLLIAENSDTFDSLIHVLSASTQHNVGLVGWGGGTAFEASVLSIARLTRPVREVAYFGDLDEKGLRAPRNAAALAAQQDLPVVRPAVGLYEALFARARPQSGQRKTSPTVATELTSWLDPAHRTSAAAHLLGGERLAQEAVGLSYLTRSTDWLHDLR
jgi:hypothetical protein